MIDDTMQLCFYSSPGPPPVPVIEMLISWVVHPATEIYLLCRLQFGKSKHRIINLIMLMLFSSGCYLEWLGSFTVHRIYYIIVINKFYQTWISQESMAKIPTVKYNILRMNMGATMLVWYLFEDDSFWDLTEVLRIACRKELNITFVIWTFIFTYTALK